METNIFLTFIINGSTMLQSWHRIALISIIAVWSMSELRMRSAAQTTVSLSDQVMILNESTLTESSGLAFSNRRAGSFWTHNDSGADSDLFEFDRHGKLLRKIRLRSIPKAVDWEDMAAFVDGDVPRLLVADCGDNESSRRSISLFLMDEPEPSDSGERLAIQQVRVTYPDGPRDCEAVAVDVERRLIVLFTKSLVGISGVYVLPLPSKDQRRDQEVTATRIATLNIPMLTGADFDPKTGDLFVVNYFQCFRYASVNASEPLSQQFSALPTATDLPHLRQIEAVAVDKAGIVWVTSEGSPTKMQRVVTSER